MSEHDDARGLEDSAPEPFMAAMLGAYRDEEDMPHEAKARGLRRLEAAPMLVPPASGSRALWIGLAVAAGVAAIIVAPRLASEEDPATGSGAAYQGERLPSTERVSQPAIVRDSQGEGVEPITSDGQPERASETQAAPEPTAEFEAEVGIRPSGKKKRRSSAGTSPAASVTKDSLAEETALLRKAQAALSGGHTRAALSTLAEHGKRFPEGVLAEERQALTVVALCDDGQHARGRKRAQRFLAAHPGSALRERVATACPEDGE